VKLNLSILGCGVLLKKKQKKTSLMVKMQCSTRVWQ